MKIKYKNKQELEQILGILLNLGYVFHAIAGHNNDYPTVESIMNVWGSGDYNTINIHNEYDEKDIFLSIEKGGLSWEKQSTEILGALKNFKASNRTTIKIDGVGVYTARLTKDFAEIEQQKIPFEKIEEIYNSLKNNTTTFKELYVTTTDDKDHRTLVSMLFSLGWDWDGSKNADELHEKLKEFKSTVIHSNLSLGGNYMYYGDGEKEYFFPQDFVEIYDKISNIIRPIKLAHYDVIIDNDIVRVGCQKISHKKVEEIYDAMKSLRD